MLLLVPRLPLLQCYCSVAIYCHSDNFDAILQRRQHDSVTVCDCNTAARACMCFRLQYRCAARTALLMPHPQGDHRRLRHTTRVRHGDAGYLHGMSWTTPYSVTISKAEMRHVTSCTQNHEFRATRDPFHQRTLGDSIYLNTTGWNLIFATAKSRHSLRA